MQVRTIPVSGDAAAIRLHALIRPDGSPALATDRDGSGWTAIEATIEGPRGSSLAYLTLTPSMARDLAAKLTLQADFADARRRGEPGPCLCTAWSHNLYPCPNPAALDYSACRECWTPERGTQDLTMGHGEADRV